MMTIRTFLGTCLPILVLSLLASLSLADVNQQIRQLSASVDSIERDVSALEQNLLFPPVTRTKVFLSLANDADFTPQTISLRMDGREQTFHVYSAQEVDALRLGGIQSLWEGNVALGKRRVLAQFEGVNRRGESVKGEAALDFEKTLQGRALELQIGGGRTTTFTVKDWGVK